MNDRRVLMFVIVGLLVIALALGAFLIFHRPSKKTSSTQANTVTPEQTEELKRVTTFADLVPPVKHDSRIVLYGDSLVTRNSKPLLDGLKTGLSRSVEVIPAEGETSNDALTNLLPVFERPPAVLVLDISRFDGANSVPFETTVTNLTLIVKKAKEFGVEPVLVLGPTNDGMVRYADSIRAGVMSPTTYVDLTQPLLTTKDRESTTTLNSTGMDLFSHQLVDALKPLLSS